MEETYSRLYESDVDSIAVGETLYRKGTLKPYYPVVVEGIEKGNQKRLERSYILYTEKGKSFVTGKPCEQTKIEIMDLFRKS